MGSGDVAQLGERRLCKPEVAGSIPVVSIAPAGQGGPGRKKSLESSKIVVAGYKIGGKIAVFYSRRKAAFFDKSIGGYVGKRNPTESSPLISVEGLDILSAHL